LHLEPTHSVNCQRILSQSKSTLAAHVQIQRFLAHYYAIPFGFTLLACSSILPSLAAATGQTDQITLAEQATRQTSADQRSTWRARGGTLTVSFNTDLLREMKISLGADRLLHQQELTNFPLSVTEAATLEFNAPQGNLENLVGGALQSAGRFELNFAGKTKSFAGFTARPKAGTPRDLEILDSDGVVWFVSDHVHFELVDDKTRLSMRNMDLRLSRTAAEWLGDGSLTGLAVGLMEFNAPIVSAAPINLPESCAAPSWHGTLLDPGNPLGGSYQADVLLSSMSNFDYKRCSGTCDGPGGASDGSVVFAPNATLANSDTNTTADVPWHGKFDGSFPPYNNDQHPFLTWNIYRISNDGQIEHIARSGVKHAFLTLNTNCAVNCGDSHVLTRRCGDVYSSGNNDASSALGPRSEIVPAKGIWARCGSIYDRNCDGVNDNPSLSSTDNRLLVPESSITDTANYKYYYEGWYVVREDVNIYNTMGSKEFTPAYSGGQWRSSNEQPFRSGPAIDRWVDPLSPGAGNMSTEVILPAGHLKVAVRTKLLGNGNTRYDYAVMNLDYVDATLQTLSPLNIRMLDRAGISGFSVPSNQAQISNVSVKDGSAALTDWTSGRGGTVHFNASSNLDELGWSSLYSFSFEANTAPIAGKVALSGRALTDDVLVDLLVPGVDASNTLIDGFE
jgi:hypothetical protein